LAGIEVTAIRDYKSLKTTTKPSDEKEPLDAPFADLVILGLAETGNYIAVRPSGTEPKVKFYMFTFVPAEQLSLMDMTKDEMDTRMDGFEKDLRAFAHVD
jgi:phosphoglucomutase/phosphomannomutase